MLNSIYNNDIKAYKSFDSEVTENQEEFTGIENIPVRFLKNNTHVRAFHGIEKVLNRCGKSKLLKLRITAAIRQQQLYFRGLY